MIMPLQIAQINNLVWMDSEMILQYRNGPYLETLPSIILVFHSQACLLTKRYGRIVTISQNEDVQWCTQQRDVHNISAKFSKDTCNHLETRKKLKKKKSVARMFLVSICSKKSTKSHKNSYQLPMETLTRTEQPLNV